MSQGVAVQLGEMLKMMEKENKNKSAGKIKRL
jgi:hypothetical protein